MKRALLLSFLTFTLLTYGQKPDLSTCDCNELTMKGKDGKSAFKDKIAFTGKCLTKMSNGIVIEELNYSNGQLNGRIKTFYKNGKIRETVEYFGNMKQGKYFLYSENGKPIIEGSYKNKLKDGKWKYYEVNSGKLIKTTVFKFGKEKTTGNKV